MCSHCFFFYFLILITYNSCLYKDMASEIRFYHLLRSTLEQALPLIVTKAFEKGHRLLIKTNDAKEAAVLDKLLWTFDEQSFLPHGSEKTARNAEDQPIWITDKEENPNNADVLIVTSGETLEMSKDFALCCDLFDGAKDDLLQAARERWKYWRDKDAFDISYFQQTDSGGWEKKA